MLGTKAATAIGPESWRNSTLKGIKLAQTIVNKSDKACDVGRSLDPLPHLRDTVAQLSNDEIHRYAREVRAVVAKLRESLLETNEEIKSLTRGKEALEKALEHTRKDIRLNKDSQEVRMSRPPREKGHDGADDLLSAERAHLVNCKKGLEFQLRTVQQQLLVLDAARKRLFGVLQERTRVLDLLNHSLASITNVNSAMSNASSASGLRRSKSVQDGRYSRMAVNQPDPLGPYTPEADQALADAEDARARSAYLRRELREAIDRTEKLQKAAHKSVNDGLTQKLSETITLKQHLGVSLGENRHGMHRAQRWYDATDKARSYTLGPVTSSDLTTRERLDRPMVRVFQRHPGTQLPEAQEIIRAVAYLAQESGKSKPQILQNIKKFLNNNFSGGDGLLQSLAATSRNIGLLRLTQLRLRNDIKNKSAAAGVDASIIRMRRSKSNHRWNLGEAF